MTPANLLRWGGETVDSAEAISELAGAICSIAHGCESRAPAEAEAIAKLGRAIRFLSCTPEAIGRTLTAFAEVEIKGRPDAE